jgi:hypothetical protein
MSCSRKTEMPIQHGPHIFNSRDSAVDFRCAKDRPSPARQGMLVAERQVVALPSDCEGSNAMSYYRLYFMDRASGHIVRFAEFHAPTDGAATALARENEGYKPLELWCRHRKVIRLEPISATARLRAAELSGV